MKHIHFFQWNVPKDNQFSERTSCFIDIIASWDSDSFYKDGTPIVYIELVNPTIYTCIQVKDWFEAEGQIKQIARNHFAELAKAERINKARAELIAAGELQDNPILTRYEADLLTQQTLS